MPLRTPLDPVCRYQERVNRARSSNSSSNLAMKLPASSSPAPRSANKERPPLVSKRQQTQPPSPPAVPFRMGDGLKNNPFLVADKVSKKPTPPLPPPAPESNPIKPLSDEQRAALLTKRRSISRLASAKPAEPPLPPDGKPLELPELTIDTEPETGVQVMPTGSVTSPTISTLEPEVTVTETEMPTGADVQVMPTSSVTSPTILTLEPEVTVTETEMPTVADAALASGDLAFRDGPPAELLEALSKLPDLDNCLAQARAVEASAESLAEVLRRSKRCNKRARR